MISLVSHLVFYLFLRTESNVQCFYRGVPVLSLCVPIEGCAATKEVVAVILPRYLIYSRDRVS